MVSYQFDIHGIVSLSIEAPSVKIAELFFNELHSFQVEAAPYPDLTITFKDAAEVGETIAVAEKGRLLRNSNGAEVFSISGVTWQFDDLEGPLRVCCRRSVNPHFMWHVVEQLIKIKFLQRGFAFVHASAFEWRGKCYAIVGWRGMGKTTFLFEALRKGCGYLADDFIIVGKDGAALSYAPRGVFLSKHQRERYGNSRGEASASARVATRNLVRRSAKYMPGKRFLRKAFPRLVAQLAPVPEPELVYTDILALFPEIRVPRRASLSDVWLLSTLPESPVKIDFLQVGDALDRTIASTIYDFQEMLKFFAIYCYMRQPSPSTRYWVGGFSQRLREILSPCFQELGHIVSISMPLHPPEYEVAAVVDKILDDRR
jgi:hypothetical protein